MLLAVLSVIMVTSAPKQKWLLCKAWTRHLCAAPAAGPGHFRPLQPSLRGSV